METQDLFQVHFGISNFSFDATMLIDMKPVLDEIPLFGGFSISCLNPPIMDFKIVGLGSGMASQLPSLVRLMKSQAASVFSDMMVLPNSMYINSVPLYKLDLPSLKFKSPPLHCLRVEILEARNLPAADFDLLGHGSSDPYVIFKLGPNQCARASCMYDIIFEYLNSISFNQIFE